MTTATKVILAYIVVIGYVILVNFGVGAMSAHAAPRPTVAQTDARATALADSACGKWSKRASQDVLNCRFLVLKVNGYSRLATMPAPPAGDVYATHN